MSFLKTRASKFVGILLLVLVLILLISKCNTGKAKTANQPITVKVTDVVQRDVPIKMEWIGTTDGYVNAQIRAQVTGYLIKQNYKEGTVVEKGDLLFEIDPRTFKAALDQAKYELAQAQAKYGKTQLDVKRYTPLAEEQAISQEELDDAIQANLAAKAQVAAAEAAVEQAQLNLNFTKITSPITGIAGLAQAQIGDLVGQGQDEVLTTVSTLDPIKVIFPISEQQYIASAKKINSAEKMPETERDTSLQIALADGSIYPEKGRFDFIDRQVDPRTGTVKVVALFPNPGNILRPGVYAKVLFYGNVKKDALLVPQRSVMDTQGFSQVAVVKPDDTVQIVNVTPGAKDGTLQVIDSGLKYGDRVVVEGLQKIRGGQKVNPVPVASETKASQPTDSTSAN